MGRSIVTGKERLAVGSWRLAAEAVHSDQSKIQNPKPKIQKGFSLLELMIVMFIMIILLSLAVPTYERSVRHAREVVLKENLFQMRRAIDQYAADKGKLPQSIESLVEGKYLREKPIDPIKEESNWDEIQGEDPNSPDAEQGLINVKSLAEGADTEGVSFKEY